MLRAMSGRLAPLTLDERQARGFCTCAQVSDDAGSSGTGTCSVHQEGRELPEEERTAREMRFYDDRRDRYVTWPDAVEAMRQGRYASATNPELALFTWMNLMRLLMVLRDHTSQSEGPDDEAEANDLIAWAQTHVPPEHLRWLLVFARGGSAGPMCDLLRWHAIASAA
jgi:hypothetical protein